MTTRRKPIRQQYGDFAQITINLEYREFQDKVCPKIITPDGSHFFEMPFMQSTFCYEDRGADEQPFKEFCRTIESEIRRYECDRPLQINARSVALGLHRIVKGENPAGYHQELYERIAEEQSDSLHLPSWELIDEELAGTLEKQLKEFASGLKACDVTIPDLSFFKAISKDGVMLFDPQVLKSYLTGPFVGFLDELNKYIET